MEFLDPAAKKARTTRLLIGYALLAIAVALATIILVYQAQGFGYDASKGVTRNGLLFIDSKPVSAAISLDNKGIGSNTNARLNLPEGAHSIKLTAAKYRDWTNQFTIDGGEVKYLLYPRLFPKDIPLAVTRVLPQAPVWAKQSPDRHWLVYQPVESNPVVVSVDLQKPSDEPIESTLPATILPVEGGSVGIVKPVEWSDDNKHLLLVQILPSGHKNYIQFNRENPEQSIDITKLLGLTVDQELVLRDKKYDKFYVFSPSKGELSSAILKADGLSQPFASGVVTFKSHGDNIIFYVTYDGAKDNEANLVVMTDQKNKYNLKPIARDPSNKYLLNQARFGVTWIYVAGSPSSDLVQIYRNPLNRVKAASLIAAPAQISLRIKNPQFVSFSDNTRFLAIQSGTKFVVYDAENTRINRYEMPISIALDQEAKWMDGHRLTANSDGRVFAFDFDGTNQQNLVANKPGFGAYFDRDYKNLFTFVPQADDKVGFQSAQLVL